jgi:hypothetical protein
MRHAVEEGLVEPTRVLQIGIRGPLAGGEDLEFTRRNGIRVTTVDDIRIGGLEAFIAGLPVFDQGPTYITFDIDCLDPAFAPGTSDYISHVPASASEVTVTPSDWMPIRTGVRVSCRAKYPGASTLTRLKPRSPSEYAISASFDMYTSCSSKRP